MPDSSNNRKIFIYLVSSLDDVKNFELELKQSIKQLEELKTSINNERKQITESETSTVAEISTSIAKAAGYGIAEYLLAKILFPGAGMLAWEGFGWNKKRNQKEEEDENKESSDLVLREQGNIVETFKLANLRKKNEFEIIAIPELPPEIEFLPGHPLPNTTYRQHPLGRYIESKQNLYIPVESYYDEIFKERQAELMKILTDLGAKKIIIKEEIKSSDKKQASANVNVAQQGVQGGGEISGSNLYKVTDECELIGKPWREDMTIDESKYIWLEHESDWKAMVYQRINGGLFKKTLSISTDISSQLTGNMGLAGNLKQVFDLNLEGAAGKDNMKDYVFEIEFSKPNLDSD